MSTERVAFCPKSGYEDPDGLGAVFVNDSTEVNLRAEVAKGKGYVVTDNPAIIQRLDNVAFLKRVSLAEAEDAVKPKASRAASGDGGKS